MSRNIVKVASVLAAALITASGCAGDLVEEPTTSEVVLDSTQPGDTPPEASFAFRVALLGDPATDNPWSIWDLSADVWSAMAVGIMPSLYQLVGPGRTLVPYLAVENEPPTPARGPDGWEVMVHLRTDARWSDGEPIDSHDVVFTFETVKRYRLGGNFTEFWPTATADDPETEVDETVHGLIGVDAPDPETVVLRFDTRPGLAIWNYGVSFAPIFPEHFWGPVARAGTQPIDLEGAPGLGSPTADGYTSTEWERGAFFRKRATDDFWDSGSTWTAFETGGIEYRSRALEMETYGDASGPVVAEWVEGPFAEEVIYSVYSDQNSALLALTTGEVDYFFSPLGLERGLAQVVLGESSLSVATNPAPGFRYLAFNLRKFPMSEPAFRRAIACRIDKEFMANTVLGGSALSVDTLVPEAFPFWHNDQITAPCAGMNEQQRLEEALRILSEAGWTWDVVPEWNDSNRDVIPKGKGLTGPDGTPVGALELLAPGPGYDPLRATYSLFVAKWAQDLGIAVEAEPTGFSVIIEKVFGAGEWDMYILGWGFREFPSYVFSFFETGNEFNTPGYANPEFDALARRFAEATTVDEARDLVMEGEAIIARDLPYVVLFTTPIIEAYRSDLAFPFTQVIGGLANNPERSIRLK